MNEDASGVQQPSFERASLHQQAETASGGNKRKRKARAGQRMILDGAGSSSSGGEVRNGEFEESLGLSRGGTSAAEGTEVPRSASSTVDDNEGGASSAVSAASDSIRGGRRVKTPRVVGGASTAAEAASEAVQDNSRLRRLQGVGRGRGDDGGVVEAPKAEDRGAARRRGEGERPSKVPRRLGGSGTRASSSEAAAAGTASVSGFQEHVASVAVADGGGAGNGVGDAVIGVEEAVVGTVHPEGNFSSSSPSGRGVQEARIYPQTRRSSARRERLQSSPADGFDSNNTFGTGERVHSTGEKNRNGVGTTLGGGGGGASGGGGSGRVGRGSRTSLAGGMGFEEARDGGASAASVERQSEATRGGDGGVTRGRGASRNERQRNTSGGEGESGGLVRLETEQDAGGADNAEGGGGVADAALGVVEEVGEGGNEEGGGMLASALEVVRAENLTIDDFQCNICWEMLARPVTLVCGHTACESCMAKYLRSMAQTQAQRGNLRANRIACPAGCQRLIPLVLPEVTTIIQKLLSKGFPRAYQARLQEADAEHALVTQIRRVAEDAAAESRRRRRRHQHQLMGGLIGGGVGVDGGAGDGAGRGDVMGFRRGVRGPQNAARFRVDVAVPQEGFPPTLARWYKRIGLFLFVCLTISWAYEGKKRDDDIWQHPGLSFLRGAGQSKAAGHVMNDEYYSDSYRVCSRNGDEAIGEGACVPGGLEGGMGDGASPTLSPGKGIKGSEGRWLFSMGMNLQEFITSNRWAALRSLYPWNHYWSSTLYLYLSDPILITRSTTSSNKKRTGEGASSFSPASEGTRWVSNGVVFSVEGEGYREVFMEQTFTFQTDGGNAAAEVTFEPGGFDDSMWLDIEEGAEAAAEAGSTLTHGGRSDGSNGVGDGHRRRKSGSGNGGKEGRGGEAKEEPRRIFLEFYGPIVGFFSAMGLSTRASELLTVLAAQACPILAAAPLLRLSLASGWEGGGGGGGEGAGISGLGNADDLLSFDFSLDLLIYVVFKLVVTTVSFWRSKYIWIKLTRRFYGASAWRVVLVSCARHLIWEIVSIKVLFPLMEHVVFHYFLRWSSRYLFAWGFVTIQIGVLKLLTLLNMVLMVLSLFFPPGAFHTVEVLWYNLVTHLLLGSGFLEAFFVDGRGFRRRRHNGAERAARRLARAMRQIPRAENAANDPAPAAGADANVNPAAGANADPENANANGAVGGNNGIGAGPGGGGGGVLGGVRDEDLEELLREDRVAGAAERVEQRAVEAAQRALVAAAAAAGAPQRQQVGAGAGAGAAEGWMDRLWQRRAAARGGVAGVGGVVAFARGRAAIGRGRAGAGPAAGPAAGAGAAAAAAAAGAVAAGAGAAAGGGGGDRRGIGLLLALAGIGGGEEEDRGQGRQEG